MFTHKIDDEISLALPRPDLDAEPIFNLIKDSYDELKVWLPWADYIKEILDEKNFLKSELNDFINNESLSTIILYKGQIAGMISFNRFSSLNNSTEIGYWLGTKFVGHNIMHRAVLGMCELGFNEYNINKIIINPAVDNGRSNSVAKKAGFTLDGVERSGLKLNDGYHDCNVWSLLKEEWK